MGLRRFQSSAEFWSQCCWRHYFSDQTDHVFYELLIRIFDTIFEKWHMLFSKKVEYITSSSSITRFFFCCCACSYSLLYSALYMSLHTLIFCFLWWLYWKFAYSTDYITCQCYHPILLGKSNVSWCEILDTCNLEAMMICLLN